MYKCWDRPYSSPPSPSSATRGRNMWTNTINARIEERMQKFLRSVCLEFSGFRQCSHMNVFSSSSSSSTTSSSSLSSATTTGSSSLSLPPTVKGGEGGWVAPLEEENNYLGHIHTQTLLYTHTDIQPHKYNNTWTHPLNLLNKNEQMSNKSKTNKTRVEVHMYLLPPLPTTCVTLHLDDNWERQQC